MTPQDETSHLKARVEAAIARKTPLYIHGGNTRYFYGRPVDASDRLDMTGHQGIVLYEPTELAITVRCGTKLRDLVDLLAAENQALPFEPPSFGPDSTIGGVIASGLAGPRRPYTGAVRDSLLGARIINGKGEVLQFGGQVMKNVAGYDLSRPMAGALGTLGVLLEVSLKLRPLPESEITLVKAMELNKALQTMRQLHRHPGNLSGVAWVDDRLYLRIAGCRETTENQTEQLGGQQLNNADGFWDSINNHQHLFFQDDLPLWRLSIKPATSELPLPGEQMIEWAGGQRWIKTTEKASIIRELAASAGGHATLFKSPGANESPFHPLSPALMTLHRQLKQALDPDGIFNPGRMFKGL